MTNARQTPENGHTLLLMERNENYRTYSDYDKVSVCFEKLLDLYEKFREEKGLEADGYIFSDVTSWLDEFFSIELMIFDKDIARYKRVDKEEMKKLLYNQTAQAQDR